MYFFIFNVCYSQLSCPCDVYPEADYIFGELNVPENNNWIPKLSRAPRESIFGSQVSHFVYDTARENWFTTKGRIYEYQQLYGKIPDDDSWFWNYYPSAKSLTSVQ